ncbi:MAG: hypothetical protein IPP40_15350 [bacterium]|nr:hypothetical protein [bacterium]
MQKGNQIGHLAPTMLGDLALPAYSPDVAVDMVEGFAAVYVVEEDGQQVASSD